LKSLVFIEKMQNQPFFPAKAILFGEYSIIRDGAALAIPLPMFGGRWAKKFGVPQFSLPDFSRSQHVFEANLDADLFQKEVSEGLFFDSNIPTGYGLGSSGAVVAAIFDRFGGDKNEADLFLLKNKLAALEGFFHGKSSGIDPLLSLLNQPILVKRDEIRPISIDFSKKMPQLFLIDTKIKRSAKPLVQWFLEKCDDVFFLENIESQLKPANQTAIDALLENDADALFEAMHEISHFQFQHFQPMIPASMRTVWLDGLASDFFKIKICGAGGGGFMLGLTTDWARTAAVLAEFELIRIF
jgi:mevalonate kinase